MTKEKIYEGSMVTSILYTKEKVKRQVFTCEADVAGMIDMSTFKLALEYDSEKIEELGRLGIISSAEKKIILEDLESLERLRYSVTNDAVYTKAEKPICINSGLLLENLKEIKVSFDLDIAIRKLLYEKKPIASDSSEKISPLFKTVDEKKCFGITKSLMDRIYHLPVLLEKSEVKEDGDKWKIEAELKDLGVGTLRLVHDFRAVDKEDADEYLKEYKDWMRTEGLKVLSAYWKKSSEFNSFNFSTTLTDVMQIISEENRVSYFSVKEKKKFWEATRRLEQTKLLIDLPVPQTKNKKKQTLVLEHRLIETPSWVHDDDDNTLPINIRIKMLDTSNFQKKSQIGTSIHNNTLKLHPQDILLALSLQIRQSQTAKKTHNEFDEDFLIERCNLKKTAQANKRKARQDVKRKLKNLEEAEIIQGFSISDDNKKMYRVESMD